MDESAVFRSIPNKIGLALMNLFHNFNGNQRKFFIFILWLMIKRSFNLRSMKKLMSGIMTGDPRTFGKVRGEKNTGNIIISTLVSSRPGHR